MEENKKSKIEATIKTMSINKQKIKLQKRRKNSHIENCIIF